MESFIDSQNIWILVFSLVLIIFVFIFFFKIKNIKENYIKLEKKLNNNINKINKIEEKNYDTFIHHSSHTLTFDGVYNFLLKYDSDIVNLNNCKFTNQIVSYESVINYQDNPKNYMLAENFNTHINNKYIEVFDDKNYFGLSKDKFQIEKPVELYIGDYDNQMYISFYKRFEDDKKFIFVSMTQNKIEYNSDENFKGVVQMIKTMKEKYKDKAYIITGNLNVQGHEEIFKEYLKDALICNVSQDLCTCNDLLGIASPDSLVVSNKLYKKIEYEINFLKGFTLSHYPILAKFYKEGNNEVINNTSYGFKQSLKSYLENTAAPVFINKKSLFDPKKHNVEEICQNKEIVNIYNNKNISKKNYI